MHHTHMLCVLIIVDISDMCNIKQNYTDPLLNFKQAWNYYYNNWCYVKKKKKGCLAFVYCPLCWLQGRCRVFNGNSYELHIFILDKMH